MDTNKEAIKFHFSLVYKHFVMNRDIFVINEYPSLVLIYKVEISLFPQKRTDKNIFALICSK